MKRTVYEQSQENMNNKFKHKTTENKISEEMAKGVKSSLKKMQQEQPKIKEEVIKQRDEISDDCVTYFEKIEGNAPGSINNAEVQICDEPPAEQVKIKKEKIATVAPNECSSSDESTPPRMREFCDRQMLMCKEK